MYQICEEIKPESKEMREVFAQVMDELAGSDSRVVYLDADIINSIKMTSFSKKISSKNDRLWHTGSKYDRCGCGHIGNRAYTFCTHLCSLCDTKGDGSGLCIGGLC